MKGTYVKTLQEWERSKILQASLSTCDRKKRDYVMPPHLPLHSDDGAAANVPSCVCWFLLGCSVRSILGRSTRGL